MSLLGVIMVYLSGYLIEASGSWASVFGLITVVNLLGLATFLSFAEARRVDIDLVKGRYHNIHIWEHRGLEQSNTIRIYGVLCMRGGEGHREMTGSEKKGDVLNSHWFLHYGNYFALFGWREYWKSCRTILNRSVIDYKEPQDEECYWVFC